MNSAISIGVVWLADNGTTADMMRKRHDRWKIKEGGMRKMLMKAVMVIISLCFGFSVGAQENMKFDSEAKKLKFIRQMLSKEKALRLSEDSPKYCAGMMKDLLTGKNFKAIEPDVMADSEDDPKIAKWRKCDGADSHDFNIDARNLFWGLDQLGAPPYRYYRIELDSNPKNGPEDMIYTEGSKATGVPAGYTWVDLSKCEIQKGSGFVATGAESHWSEKPNAVYLNTLVNYKRKLWAVDFVDGFDFSLSRWIDDRSGMEICRWWLFKPKKSE